MGISRWFSGLSAALGAALLPTVVRAQDGLETIGRPEPGGMGFQTPVTELARDIVWLDTTLLYIITAVSVFVLALLAIVIFRFNRARNPEPASFTHNATLEVAWTVVPIIILIFIGSLSLPVLFKQLEIPEADLTIKTTGNQWYWTYEYPDEQLEFDAFMLQRDELVEHGYGEEDFLLATDTAVVVPVDAVVRLQVTAGDVIHAWKIPAFGVHMDAIPGRLNETWFQAEREGIYFGQCSELCGKDHSYMPIVVKVVSEEAYAAWLEEARELYATGPRRENNVDVAQATE
ncbi:MAG: cytochrome c oxidase subunit II [Pseudomonadota bacterium]